MLSLDDLHRLRERVHRDRSQRAFVEGVRFVLTAHRARRLEQLIVARGRLRSYEAHRVVERQRRAGVPVLEVSEEQFLELSQAAEPSGIGAVVRQRWQALPAGRPKPGALWLGFESVRAKGNLGTILRTADAVGAHGAIFFGEQVDPYDPVVVRATMGSVFAQRFVRTDARSFAGWKRRLGYHVVGTSAGAPCDYREGRYGGPLVVMMGCERSGMSPTQSRLCDERVSIPMVGQLDSLNLAVATGVMLYQVHAQRRPRRRRPRRRARDRPRS